MSTTRMVGNEITPEQAGWRRTQRHEPEYDPRAWWTDQDELHFFDEGQREILIRLDPEPPLSQR